MAKIDFKKLAEELLTRSEAYCLEHIPEGKKVGREYVASTISGGKGDSFSINLNNGKWADFATGEGGNDIISHYAKLKGVRQVEAAKYLQDWLGNTKLVPVRPRIRPAKPSIGPPPKGAPKPDFKSATSQVWTYNDADGAPLFYIERYETPEGKSFCPHTWDTAHKRWIKKHYPTPRPLFGLEQLNGNERPCLIVEGEKSASAAKQLCKSYDVVTWPNGAGSVDYVDWSPIYGRHILIWPDADEDGMKAALKIIEKLKGKCPKIKMIRPPTGTKVGFDAADAVKIWDDRQWLSWARNNVEEIEQPKPKVLPPEQPKITGPHQHIPIEISFSEDFDPPTPEVAKLLAEATVTTQGQHGNPICNGSNVFKIMKKMPKPLVWYDEFHNKFFTDNFGPTREWEEKDDNYLLEFFQDKLGFHRLSMTAIQQGVMRQAYMNVKNEPKDWIKTLEWDQRARIEEFMVKAFGCVESDYVKSVSKNFWVSLAARIMQPGAKVDSMVILEGPQGSLKSSALQEIGGKWFAEINESVTNKDFFVYLQGKILVELPELDAVNRAEVTTIKRVITTPTDRLRMPYSRNAKDFPRTCIFVGTTNEDNYLRDVTGARRFWPIRVKRINLEYIRENRNQLFAEARVLYSNGMPWWEMPRDETEIEQEKRRSYDEWEGIIANEYEGSYAAEQGLSIATIAKEALDITKDRLEKRTQLRIASCLKALGWKKRHTNAGKKWYLTKLEQ